MAHLTILGSLPTKARGFTYLLVLSFIILVMLSLTVTSEHFALTQQREREAELIFIGKQYQAAIASYYHQSPGIKTFPNSLDDLLSDSRSQVTKHHLRKRYRDPMLNTDEWGLIKDEFGKITGVYSLSHQKPVKTNVDFLAIKSSGETTYADWKFEYVPINSVSNGAGE